MAPGTRTRPNILITGTPGTGKSSLTERLAQETGLTGVEVSVLAKEQELTTEYDEELDTHVIDEDKVIDALEPQMSAGGNIVDYHGCDFFPERWFDLVVVLTCDNSVLYERLKDRDYSENKIKQNIECEIFQTLVEEARDSYKEEIIKVCNSSTIEDMESNERAVVQWVAEFSG